MLKVRTKKDFLKDFNKHILSGRITESDVTSVVDCLKEQKPLHKKYCDHALSGNLKGLRECHNTFIQKSFKKPYLFKRAKELFFLAVFFGLMRFFRTSRLSFKLLL